MLQYIVRRLLQIPISLIGIFTITFALLYIVPGDPVSSIVGQHADAETIAAIRSELNLDKPIWQQYFYYLGDTIQGDFGRSFISRREVFPEILDRFPATLQLALAAICVTILLGIPLGVISAIFQYSWVERTLMVGAIAGISAPSFWVGLIVIWIFGMELKLFPIGGYSDNWSNKLWYLALPALVLGMRGVAIVGRLTRSSMLEIIRQDYIRTARAKGLSERVVMVKHALRNALIPVVTYLGMDMGFLLGGAVITESVFQWPGVGRLAVQALRDLDIPLVLGTVMFSATLIVIANLLTDLSYAFLDPRVRLSRNKGSA